MDTNKIDALFTADALLQMFPKERSDEFFDALFGDASEGSYDILTQGLPQVFSRHPIINVKGVVEDVDTLLGDDATCTEWALGYTEQREKAMHIIPINILLS